VKGDGQALYGFVPQGGNYNDDIEFPGSVLLPAEHEDPNPGVANWHWVNRYTLHIHMHMHMHVHMHMLWTAVGHTLDRLCTDNLPFCLECCSRV
jgi:hypothetical protein